MAIARPNLADIVTALDAMDDFLAGSEAALQQHVMPDFTSFEMHVMTTTSAIQQLPVSQALQYITRLEGILAKCDQQRKMLHDLALEKPA